MRFPLSARGLALALPLLFVAGCVGGGCAGATLSHDRALNARYVPLPHHVAKSPDALSFRFAMVHDVVHERFPKHGPAFYQERNRRARAKLATVSPDSEEAFALTDDLGAGLDRLGQPAEAVPLLRDKLTRQVRTGLSGRALYTSYANLGTFLIHANMKGTIAGDSEARARVVEGRDLIRQSIEVNPNAHFGREEWQLVAVETFLEFGLRPELLREYDLIGNRLNRDVSPSIRALHADSDDTVGSSFVGRPYTAEWSLRIHTRRVNRETVTGPLSTEERAELRKIILNVGREGADGKRTGDFGRAAPFDEPCLGIIGMWRQGGGANPHFALCLGEIMLRVGQRYLAWSCYERAARLAERSWPSPDLQQYLRDHCRARQLGIEKTMAAADVEQLRPRFEAELAHGERYQAEYQAFEREKIAAGGDIDDPTFFDDFHAGREPIASRPGPEEWYVGESSLSTLPAKFREFVTWGLLTGGLCVLVFGLWVRHRAQ
jgi:hypothetical protein